jgi:hypothetical protein
LQLTRSSDPATIRNCSELDLWKRNSIGAELSSDSATILDRLELDLFHRNSVGAEQELSYCTILKIIILNDRSTLKSTGNRKTLVCSPEYIPLNTKGKQIPTKYQHNTQKISTITMFKENKHSHKVCRRSSIARH